MILMKCFLSLHTQTHMGQCFVGDCVEVTRATKSTEEVTQMWSCVELRTSRCQAFCMSQIDNVQKSL